MLANPNPKGGFQAGVGGVAMTTPGSGDPGEVILGRSNVAEEEDEDEDEEWCMIQSGAMAATQGRRGGEDGVRFIPRESHVTDVSLTTGNTHLYRQSKQDQD